MSLVKVKDDKISELLKNPSEIYSYAYDMLVRENFSEAEKSFKAFNAFLAFIFVESIENMLSSN